MKKTPFVQFFIKEDNSIEVMVANKIYESEEVFRDVMMTLKKWTDFQIPNMEKTFENVKKLKK